MNMKQSTYTEVLAYGATRLCYVLQQYNYNFLSRRLLKQAEGSGLWYFFLLNRLKCQVMQLLLVLSPEQILHGN
jgi:hypothetical protein